MLFIAGILVLLLVSRFHNSSNHRQNTKRTRTSHTKNRFYFLLLSNIIKCAQKIIFRRIGYSIMPPKKKSRRTVVLNEKAECNPQVIYASIYGTSIVVNSFIFSRESYIRLLIFSSSNSSSRSTFLFFSSLWYDEREATPIFTDDFTATMASYGCYDVQLA